MKISVVMPCFNAADLVAQAVTSIIDQTYRDWELIAIDDASTDATADVIDSFRDERIRLIQLPENRGYPHAMNVGIQLAQGEFIARMDADDISDPRRFVEQIEAMRRFPQASFCGTNRFLITPGGKLLAKSEKSTDYYISEDWERLYSGCRTFTDASVLIKKSIVDSVGGYRSYQRSGMDVDLWLRVMERYGPCVTIAVPLYGRRLNPNSLVFQSVTPLVNQIPRVLAMQRKVSGSDDIERGDRIEIETYVNKGLISKGRDGDGIQLAAGTCATCLRIGDLYGAYSYFRHAMVQSRGLRYKVAGSVAILRKCVGRVFNNPYRRHRML